MNERFETFTVLINRISRNIRKIEIQSMSEYDFRSSHCSCLYYLFTLGSMTAVELCEHCEEDKATISRAVSYLEEKGYLSCDSKSAKRYKSPLSLTEKGMEAGKHMAMKLEKVLAESNSGMTIEELSAFYRSLSIISKNLESIAKNERY